MLAASTIKDLIKAEDLPATYKDYLSSNHPVSFSAKFIDLVEGYSSSYFASLKKRTEFLKDKISTVANRDMGMAQIIRENTTSSCYTINGKLARDLFARYLAKCKSPDDLDESIKAELFKEMINQISPDGLLARGFEIYIQDFKHQPVYAVTDAIESHPLYSGKYNRVLDQDTTSFKLSGGSLTAKASTNLLGFKNIEDNTYCRLKVKVSMEYEFVKGLWPDTDCWLIKNYILEGSIEEVCKAMQLLETGLCSELFEEKSSSGNESFRWGIVEALANITKAYLMVHTKCDYDSFNTNLSGRLSPLFKEYLTSINPELANNGDVRDQLKEYLFNLFSNPFEDIEHCKLSEVLVARHEYLGDELDSIGFDKPCDAVMSEINKRIGLLTQLRELVVADDAYSQVWFQRCVEASGRPKPEYFDVLLSCQDAALFKSPMTPTKPSARSARLSKTPSFSSAAKASLSTSILFGLTPWDLIYVSGMETPSRGLPLLSPKR